MFLFGNGHIRIAIKKPFLNVYSQGDFFWDASLPFWALLLLLLHSIFFPSSQHKDMLIFSWRTLFKHVECTIILFNVSPTDVPRLLFLVYALKSNPAFNILTYAWPFGEYTVCNKLSRVKSTCYNICIYEYYQITCVEFAKIYPLTHDCIWMPNSKFCPTFKYQSAKWRNYIYI